MADYEVGNGGEKSSEDDDGQSQGFADEVPLDAKSDLPPGGFWLPPAREVVTNDPVEVGQTIGVEKPQKTHQLRLWTLWILVGTVGAGLVLIALGLAMHWFDTDFAKTILQTVVSPILGALSAVVGYLFADRKTD
ncbi:hypothetical protein ACIRSS_21775 [Amycolatopsis sp. NPDC101161]|uniref:hypothetical protein n=1 Tax=Amycolatopsis sp. NPDC101161 TaxID=3363940 RepID=UPI0037F3FDCB